MQGVGGTVAANTLVKGVQGDATTAQASMKKLTFLIAKYNPVCFIFRAQQVHSGWQSAQVIGYLCSGFNFKSFYRLTHSV